MRILIIIVLSLIIWWFWNKFVSLFKFPKVGAVAVITGGLKTGKTAISLAIARFVYRCVHRRWKIKVFLGKVFNLRCKDDLEPVFYSSIPLACDYVPLTRDLLLMKKRIVPKSVVFIDEVSLIADSMLFKDKEINEQLLKFFKLFGHISHGGLCVFNSHCLTDLHFALKRTTSQYFYIHHTVKLPFLSFTKMREERYSEDNTTLNNYPDDVENTLKTCIFRSRVFKEYDCYAYSLLTDDLPVQNDIVRGKNLPNLKATEIPSFNPVFYNMFQKKEDLKNEKENNSKCC